LKRLIDIFGVAPEIASKLEEADIRTARDLVVLSDLSQLSEKTGILVDELAPLQSRAAQEVNKSRRRRRHLAIVLVGSFALLSLFILSLLYSEIKANAPISQHVVTIRWNASPSPNVIGYNIYRSTSPSGPFVRINSSIVSGLLFSDATVKGGMAYYYVTTALNSHGYESHFSNEKSVHVGMLSSTGLNAK
jgi:hypothetical protein